MHEQIVETSQRFWNAMEHANEAGIRAIADPNCNFVHIGITCKLDKEIEFYTSGAFQPTQIIFHDKKVDVFGRTAVVLTDCDYSLLGLLTGVMPMKRLGIYFVALLLPRKTAA